jgi:hypothetical protein
MAASMSIAQVAGSGTCVNDELDVEPPLNVAMSNVSPVPEPMVRVS